MCLSQSRWSRIWWWSSTPGSPLSAPALAPPTDLSGRTPDRREILRRIGRDGRLRLLQRSDRKGLVHVTGHMAALALTGTAIALEAPGWPMLLLPHGILLAFLFCLQHEATHGTPFRSAWLNSAAAWGVGLLVFLPPAWFRHFHLAHHRHTHDPERDPELARPLSPSRAGLAWHVSGGSYWVREARVLLVNAAGRNRDAFVPQAARRAVAHEARLFLLFYAIAAALSVHLGTAALLWLWLIPLLLGQPFLRLYLLAEHTGCPHVPDMLRNTRTTLTNPLLHFIAWNMPYHAEHHALPAVPFHELPVLHRILREDLRVTANGYPAAARAAVVAVLGGKA